MTLTWQNNRPLPETLRLLAGMIHQLRVWDPSELHVPAQLHQRFQALIGSQATIDLWGPELTAGTFAESASLRWIWDAAVAHWRLVTGRSPTVTSVVPIDPEGVTATSKTGLPSKLGAPWWHAMAGAVLGGLLGFGVAWWLRRRR